MQGTLPDQRQPVPNPNGNMMSVQVLDRTPLARDVVSLALVAPGTRHAPGAYLPGQFITLAFASAHRTYYRSYSLCGDGSADSPWEITFKRHDAGLISRHLFDRIQPGMLLQASPPQGTFTLPAPVRPNRPLVFVAGGSGIAPIYGMLRALARLAPAQRPRVWLHYTCHTPADVIYGRELTALDPQSQWLTQWHYVTSTGYRLRPEHVLTAAGADATRAEWYVCGPTSLTRAIEAAALRHGLPAARFHREVFASPATGNLAPARGGRAAIVRLADSGAAIPSAPGATLLETLEHAGYHPAFSCRVGECGTCRLRLVSGQVSGGGGGGLTPAESAAGEVLSCVAYPVGEVTLASAGTSVLPGRSPRRPGQRALRLSLTAAAAALFVTAWGFTNHSPVTAASSTGTNNSSNSAAPSNSNTSPSNQGGDDGGGGGIFGQNPYGSGSFSAQPGSGQSNTTTGVS